MEPTLLNSDWVAYDAKFDPTKLVNHIVVTNHPHTDALLIKRVLKVTQSHVFLVGDHPEESTDSRSFGAVPISKVKGIVRCFYRRSI